MKRIKKTVPKLIEMNRMESGDIKITVSTKKAKAALLKDTKWIKIVGTSTTLRRRTFAVMIYSIRVKRVDTNKQRKEIERLQELNGSLHKNIKIVKIDWLVKTIKDKKTFSSFLIEIEIVEMTNQILIEGFVLTTSLSTTNDSHVTVQSSITTVKNTDIKINNTDNSYVTDTA